MTIWLEGNRSIFMGAQAFLIDNDHEMASSWAGPHILTNAAYKWVLGRFVEADRANDNRQMFTLGDLQMARPTITHAPMNMNHSQRKVVGAFVATDMIYPTEGAAEAAGASDAGLNPYIEALGVFWRHYFPEDYVAVEDAHAEGRLFYSMECVPDQIQCSGESGCGTTFEYAGRQSPNYCDHLNEHASDKLLLRPHFTAGAILVPPVRPGWSNADIHSLVAKHAELAEHIYAGLKAELSHLDPRDWELLMAELIQIATA